VKNTKNHSGVVSMGEKKSYLIIQILILLGETRCSIYGGGRGRQLKRERVSIFNMHL
jgi:hypothetical protein